MKTSIGLIGLGVMGANLARNAARNGASVTVFNRTTEKTEDFMKNFSSEGTFVAAHTLKDFVENLPSPRNVFVMVKAGQPTDDVIEELIPLLKNGDAIIDCGNSHYADTNRREKHVKKNGLDYLGMGVSGGEEGALNGPSMMPGGSKTVFDRLEPLLKKMAAKDGGGGKCVSYIGPGGAGHFVKMVHNGIEYGDMQLIAESYHLMKASGMKNAEIGETFEKWNKSKDLKSYLIEITGKIFRKKDDQESGDLIDAILDVAEQKGTGKWTVQIALDLGMPIPTIAAAVDARGTSSMKGLREKAEKEVGALETKPVKLAASLIKDALFLSKICSYAQGYRMIQAADKEFGWGINLAEVSRIWKGGCIIRSTLLKEFEKAFADKADLPSLILSPSILPHFQKKQRRWRKVIATAVNAGIPVPAMNASLASFDSLRTARLPQNLTQAQRDFFGAHTYKRVDKEGIFHTQWE